MGSLLRLLSRSRGKPGVFFVFFRFGDVLSGVELYGVLKVGDS